MRDCVTLHYENCTCHISIEALLESNKRLRSALEKSVKFYDKMQLHEVPLWVREAKDALAQEGNGV